MVDGFLAMLPAAKVGHIGMYRDHETLEPVEYFVNLPTDIQERQLFIVDPMLATGGSAIAAIEALEKRGASPSAMKFICLVAAPEGVDALHAAYPDVDIYAASLDERLTKTATSFLVWEMLVTDCSAQNNGSKKDVQSNVSVNVKTSIL